MKLNEYIFSSMYSEIVIVFKNLYILSFSRLCLNMYESDGHIDRQIESIQAIFFYYYL